MTRCIPSFKNFPEILTVSRQCPAGRGRLLHCGPSSSAEKSKCLRDQYLNGVMTFSGVNISYPISIRISCRISKVSWTSHLLPAHEQLKAAYFVAGSGI